MKIGEKAPSFKLKNTDLEDVQLEDYTGQKLVILFFPLAYTSVCTEELCLMRDNFKEYESLGAQIVGVSVDSPFVLQKFKSENNLNFPLLSDFNKTTSQAYGAYYEDFVLGLKGVSKRAAFVIDQNSIVRYCEVLENAGNLPNFEKLQEALEKI